MGMKSNEFYEFINVLCRMSFYLVLFGAKKIKDINFTVSYFIIYMSITAFQNHQHHECLFNSLFRLTTKETSKLCITVPLWGEFSGEFFSQKDNNQERASMTWCHHDHSFITECFKPNFIETGDKRVPRKIPGYLCFWVPALKQMLSFWWNFVFGCTRSFHLDNIRHNRWQIFSQNDISCFRAWGWFDYYNANLPGAHFNIKMWSYQYRDSNDKYKKVSWLSYFYNGVPHTCLYIEMIPRGAVSIWRCCLTSIGIPMLKIRRSCDRLIFNMGIPIPGKDSLYIEMAPSISGNLIVD